MAYRYALVIGISEYLHLGSLPNAVNDAEAIAQLLEQNDKYEVTRFPCFYIEEEKRYEMKSVIVGADDLEQAIEEFFAVISEKKADGLLYIASHGLSFNARFGGKLAGYLASSESGGDENKNEIISFEDLNSIFTQSEHRSLTVLLDCCHSGLALDRAVTPSNIRTEFLPSSRFAMLAACRGDQEAYEEGDHSVFTKAVLEAFQVENTNKKNQITFNLLSDFVRTQLLGSGQEPEECAVNGSDICLLEYPEKPQITQTPNSLAAVDNINRIENANFNVEAQSSLIIKVEEKLRRLNYRKQDNLFEDFLEQELKVAAFWLRHDEEGGQRWLLNRLWREKIPNTSSSIKFHLKISKRWQLDTIWNRLGSHYGVADNPEAIADHLYELWLCQQTVALVLYGVERLSRESFQGLIDQLWQPLARKTAGKSSDYPLLFFLVDTGIEDSDCCLVKHCCDYDPSQPEIVIDLPLENLKDITLKNWINTHATDLLPEGMTKDNAIEKLLLCNQSPEICVQEVFAEICNLFGYSWQDIEAKFSI